MTEYNTETIMEDVIVSKHKYFTYSDVFWGVYMKL